jgi:hypothetical protein
MRNFRFRQNGPEPSTTKGRYLAVRWHPLFLESDALLPASGAVRPICNSANASQAVLDMQATADGLMLRCVQHFGFFHAIWVNFLVVDPNSVVY